CFTSAYPPERPTGSAPSSDGTLSMHGSPIGEGVHDETTQLDRLAGLRGRGGDRRAGAGGAGAGAGATGRSVVGAGAVRAVRTRPDAGADRALSGHVARAGADGGDLSARSRRG